ncbi:Hexaprenyldihydroxybenzoate methyltransferase, mitochondrial [Saxophila tyrrhenica]|uniref:Ubiquinone biosynthesis O-methyltransferase, mitochondrial n=1 Tax=Saxophila tyrrhenica TaxID=1690608 RepID=A0AAV9PJE5_9PEZI|nr:Hexaprenyldihydroxybenzoate methyltransferase, mitochondrial [Saxophila tyrrhenica]
MSLSIQRMLALPCHVRAQVFRRVLAAPAASLRPFSTSRPVNQEPTSSVNETEVSHFNALASSWWDPHGSSRLLHLMNPLRHDFIARCRATTTKDAKEKLHYLDIGCGGGIFAESAARRSHTASVAAIDPTPSVIAVARKHQRLDPLLLEPGRLEYKQIPLEHLPVPSSPEQGYDIITLFEVLEHIRRPSALLASALPYLKPGGWIIGSTIARTNISWFTTKLMAEDVLGIVPRGTHEWGQYIMPNELFQWAKIQKELEVEQDGRGWMVQGVMYVPGLGWKEVGGSEEWGNYFFGVRRKIEGGG